jgi:hypothetical protein
MKCPSCKVRNRSDRRFCAQCGSSLVHVCAHCGFSNDAIDLFCGGCGVALQPDAGVRSIASSPEDSARHRASVARPADRSDMLSPKELGDLLKKPDDADPDALPLRVSQEDLDRLFGAKP